MNINFQKLNQLEESAKQARAVLLDIEDRRNEARDAFLRRKNRFLIDLDGSRLYPASDVVRDWLARGCRFPAPDLPDEKTPCGRHPNGSPDYALRPNPWRRQVAELADLKSRLDELEAEHARAEARWKALIAPLPALRDFAKRYGRKQPGMTARLANEAMPPPSGGSDIDHAAQGYAPAAAASSAPPTGVMAAFKGLFSR